MFILSCSKNNEAVLKMVYNNKVKFLSEGTLRTFLRFKKTGKLVYGKIKEYRIETVDLSTDLVF